MQKPTGTHDPSLNVGAQCIFCQQGAKQSVKLWQAQQICAGMVDVRAILIDHSASIATLGGHYFVVANAGLYGSFNGILYDHLEPSPIALPVSNICESYKAPEIDGVASLFGPTCDGADVICRDVSNLPKLEVGDFVAFPKMGAYSWAGACNFNGFEAVWVKFFYVTT